MCPHKKTGEGNCYACATGRTRKVMPGQLPTEHAPSPLIVRKLDPVPVGSVNETITLPADGPVRGEFMAREFRPPLPPASSEIPSHFVVPTPRPVVSAPAPVVEEVEPVEEIEEPQPVVAELRVMVEMFPELVLTRGKTQTRYPDGIRVLLTVSAARLVAKQIQNLTGSL